MDGGESSGGGVVGSRDRRDTKPPDIPFEPRSNQNAQLFSMVNTSKYILDREKLYYMTRKGGEDEAKKIYFLH